MAKTEIPYRFSLLRLKNWKNFQSVEVELPSRVFLVGPNASGKSNLLDVFRFLRDLVSPGGGFQAAVERRHGVKALRCLAARRDSDIEVYVRVSPMDGSVTVPSWEYTLVFNQGKNRPPQVRQELVLKDGRALLQRPTEEDKRDPDRLSQTHIEQVTMNQPFRELARFFEAVHYLHLVPQLVRESDRVSARSRDPYGSDFLEQVASTPAKTRTARLKRILSALQVAVPQLSAIELWRDAKGAPHLRGRYEHWRAQGAMGLLWAVLDGSGPLLLEEPELSLHPEVVRYIPPMFARVQKRRHRQIIVSTHSPEMLSDEGIGLSEVLLLTPTPEGTSVRPLASVQEANALLSGRSTAGDIAMAHTRPEKARRLDRFEP
jgi:energy-coupling factor transporter ATP-binding protein EcfA2